MAVKHAGPVGPVTFPQPFTRSATDRSLCDLPWFGDVLFYAVTKTGGVAWRPCNGIGVLGYLSPSGPGANEQFLVTDAVWDGTLLQLSIEGPAGRFTADLHAITDPVKIELANRFSLHTPSGVHYNWLALRGLITFETEHCVAAYVELTNRYPSLPGQPPRVGGSERLKHWFEKASALADAADDSQRRPLDGPELEVFCALGLSRWEGCLDELYEAAQRLSA